MHVLMPVYLLKKIWIKLKMQFFPCCSLTLQDWQSCLSNVCLCLCMKDCDVGLWCISVFTPIHLYIKYMLRKSLEKKQQYFVWLTDMVKKVQKCLAIKLFWRAEEVSYYHDYIKVYILNMQLLGGSGKHGYCCCSYFPFYRC